eukprot:CAMPEP_0194158400 /NCGR_PEP_ID=MMETSP0152-20130528/75907_1 /TAXON_ID=1049557 /ORGANISM="Thalassiothrix antarctica, Strain L6-D1" /LENGTH=162 /DNA_ID=CAMNT_0038867609 /DNA_START=139 /DNA_END=627 /DNA_ORIENTATION=+
MTTTTIAENDDDGITTPQTTTTADDDNTTKITDTKNNNNNNVEVDEISSEEALVISTLRLGLQDKTEEEENTINNNISSLTFINKGFKKWEKERTIWILQRDSNYNDDRCAKALDVDEIIDQIFSQRWRSQTLERSQFSKPVPLPQMVDILVDLWEAEGLDI